ncbi:uncharacterized protein LOC128955334 [Oppia nitens]|uniref:uncharacterized protein LOC128955334 n=1 Tax=Oppia nitens TaxID=1686743 RepID=UPI0023DA7AB9|nr:uncharacterized protein LOC128955334 [Oppia nitens]
MDFMETTTTIRDNCPEMVAETSSSAAMTIGSQSPKVWTQLETLANVSTDATTAAQVLLLTNQEVAADENMRTESFTTESMASDDNTCVEEPMTTGGDNDGGQLPTDRPVYQLQCMESGGDIGNYSMLSVMNSDRSQRPYCPSHEARELHNHKERLRRSRMKCSCEALRVLVPGVTDKTDKATVLEHTVAFLLHLSKCQGVKCTDYMPVIPPPMSAKLLDLYPTLMTGQYQYYESTTPESSFDTTQVLEVQESNGQKYITTADGYQYVIVEDADGASVTTDGHHMIAQRVGDSALTQPMELMTATNSKDAINDNTKLINSEIAECSAAKLEDNDKLEPQSLASAVNLDECQKCVQQVVDMLSENKENIDPNGANTYNIVKLKKKPGRKPKSLVNNVFGDNNNNTAITADSKPRIPKPRGRPKKIRPTPEANN